MSTIKKKRFSDEQVGGSHYQAMEIDPMTYAMANQLNACQFSIVKYVSRMKGDGQAQIEDVRKAIHCCELLIEDLEAAIKECRG